MAQRNLKASSDIVIQDDGTNISLVFSEEKKEQIDNMFNIIYPVGSIYLTVNNQSPEFLFGGEWEQIKDTFLLGAGDTFEAGSTGGEQTHLLTVEEMPSHSHVEQGAPANPSGYGNMNLAGTAYSGGLLNNSTSTVGGGREHNNMPPYLTVYIWKRIR